MIYMIEPDLALGNVMNFVCRQLIPSLHKLATLERLDAEGRTAILEIASALCVLPDLDPSTRIQFTLDLSWDDRNWIGSLDLMDSALRLHSTLLQLTGALGSPMSDVDVQWQHTALEIKSDAGVVCHDSSRLWFWIDCFRRFVDGSIHPLAGQRATFNLVTRSSCLDLNYGMIDVQGPK